MSNNVDKAVDNSELGENRVVVTEGMVSDLDGAMSKWVGKELDELCVASFPSRQSIRVFALLICEELSRTGRSFP